MTIAYQEIGAERLEVIRLLWEKLRAHHVALTLQFSVRRTSRTFHARKQELLAKSAPGKLRIDLANAVTSRDSVAYCITRLGSCPGSWCRENSAPVIVRVPKFRIYL